MAEPAFNPDKYLAEKEKLLAKNAPPEQGFDPDQYLAQKTSATAQPAGTSIPQTALEHGANAAAMGYLPQLQAAAEPVTNAIGNLGIMAKNVFSKEKQPLVQSDPYVKARDENIRRIEEQATVNPKTALASDVGGAVVGSLATPLPGGAAKGLIGGVARGAVHGAAQALVQNPGDVEGQVNPLQANERLQNAKSGAVIGAVTGGATEGTRKALGSTAKLAPALKDVAEEQAFKQSGAMLKDFRAAFGRGELKDVGRFMIDNGLASPGQTYHDIRTGAEAIRQTAGKDLEQIYGKALNTIKDPKVLENMPGFNPVRDKEKLVALVKTELGDSVKSKEAVKAVSGYIDDLAEKYGDKTLDPKLQNDIKGAIDKHINYSRNPLSPQPNEERAFKSARTYLSSKIDSSIDFLGKSIGEKDALAKLKDANKRYGFSSKISDLSQDRMQREGANQIFGLTDKISSTTGAVAGMGAASAMGDHNPAHMAGAGLLTAGAGMLANKLGRKYGTGLISRGAEIGSRVAAPASVGATAIKGLIPSAGLMSRTAVNIGREEKRK